MRKIICIITVVAMAILMTLSASAANSVPEHSTAVINAIMEEYANDIESINHDTSILPDKKESKILDIRLMNNERLQNSGFDFYEANNDNYNEAPSFHSDSSFEHVISENSQIVFRDSVLRSNDAVFRLWDLFTNDDTNEFTPPDWFAGFSLTSTGELLLYLSVYATPQSYSDALAICQYDHLQFVLVEHSFNELKDIEQYLIKNYNHGEILYMKINIRSNCVDLCLSKNADIELLAFINTSSKMVVRLLDESDYEHHTDVVLKNHNNTNNQDKSLVTPPITEESINTTLYFYPGQQSFINGSSDFGTIGFCATDSAGRNLLITHGHQYDNTAFPAPYATINGNMYAAYPMGSSISTYLDAAFILLPMSVGINIVFTNEIANNSGVHLTTVAYVSQLQCYDSAPADAYGYATAFLLNHTISLEYEDNHYKLAIIGNPNPANGDSGGPIYMTGNNQNRLIGIIQTTGGLGILWCYIQSEYYSITGNSIVAYTLGV